MEARGLNPSGDLIQWEPNGNQHRCTGVHIDINLKKQRLSWELNSGLAPRDGFEPPAKRLTAACSTAELPGTSLLARLLYSNESIRIQ